MRLCVSLNVVTTCPGQDGLNQNTNRISWSGDPGPRTSAQQLQEGGGPHLLDSLWFRLGKQKAASTNKKPDVSSLSFHVVPQYLRSGPSSSYLTSDPAS